MTDSSETGIGGDLPTACQSGDGSQACVDALDASCAALLSEDECDARPAIARVSTGLVGNFRCVWQDTVVASMADSSCVISDEAQQCYGAVFVGEGGPTCLNEGCTVQPPTPFYAEDGSGIRLVLTECGWVPLAFEPCDSEGAPSACACFCG